MLNFMTKIFAPYASAKSADNDIPKPVISTNLIPEDTQILDQEEASRPKVGRIRRRKNSSIPRTHDMDPTVELDQPLFDPAPTTQHREAIKNNTDVTERYRLAGPWNDPTVEVHLPA